MKRIKSFVLVFLVMFAGPVLTLIDLFALKPESTLTRVERIYRKEVAGHVGRTTRRATYSFIEMDNARTLQVKDHWPAEKGKYLMITRSAMLGIVLGLTDWNDRSRKQVLPAWKVLAGFAVVSLLPGVMFLLTGFDGRFGLAAVIGHACFLAMLWVEVSPSAV